MIQYFIALAGLLLCLPSVISSSIDCRGCGNQSLEIGGGWRRDNSTWKVRDLRGSSSGSVLGIDNSNSRLEFEDVEMYTVNGRARFVSDAYYIRLEADYGWTDKGRAEEHLNVSDSLYSYFASLNNAVKRRSEVYDFSAAFGYPIMPPCYRRLEFAPLVGFSFHRQQYRVKNELRPDQILPLELEELSRCPSSLSFNSCGDLVYLSHHRFTWYGPFVGFDFAFALNCDWSLWAEMEYHYGRCNRKRSSEVGVHALDHYHFTDYAHGFNGTIGTNILFCDDWFGGLYVDWKSWVSADHDDSLDWKSIGATATIGYIF